ncbi:MAG: hypothetical protein GY835_01565 [bacterium]|nr:hypothetical protein [bacterium]
MNVNNTDERDLTPEERGAFAALSREQEPGRLLEERTVAELSERGLLTGSRSRFGVPGAIWSVAAVAALAMMIASFAVGHWLGSRDTANLMLAMQDRSSEQAVASVEQTGAAYRQALIELTALRQSTAPQEQLRGREVALSTIYAAADEMLRIAPDDPLAVRIMQAFNSVNSSLPPGESPETQSVVWF